MEGSSLKETCFCVFEDDDDLTTPKSDKEVSKLKEARYLDGLRDGIEDGHKQILQEGFNVGCRHGYQKLFSIATMRGVLWVLKHHDVNEATQANIRTLEKRCKAIESEILSSRLLIPHFTENESIQEISDSSQQANFSSTELKELFEDYSALLLQLGIDL